MNRITKIALTAAATLALATGGAVSAQADTAWNNCTDVWNAGAAPIHRGDPGFQTKFDSDGDGTGCEVDPRDKPTTKPTPKPSPSSSTPAPKASTPTPTDAPQVATAPQGGVSTGDGSTAQ